jgi:hypothetical protein
MLQRLLKGKTSADVNALTATNWADFQPDDYDGKEDGNDSIHHAKLEPKVPKELLVEHEKESETKPNG